MHYLSGAELLLSFSLFSWISYLIFSSLFQKKKKKKEKKGKKRGKKRGKTRYWGREREMLEAYLRKLSLTLSLRLEVRASLPPTCLAGASVNALAEVSEKHFQAQWGNLRDEEPCRSRGYRCEVLEPREPTSRGAGSEERNWERWGSLRDGEVFCPAECCRIVLV